MVSHKIPKNELSPYTWQPGEAELSFGQKRRVQNRDFRLYLNYISFVIVKNKDFTDCCYFSKNLMYEYNVLIRHSVPLPYSSNISEHKLIQIYRHINDVGFPTISKSWKPHDYPVFLLRFLTEKIIKTFIHHMVYLYNAII